MFEHVRRPITVAEVHGGSMRLALRLSVGSHAIISLRGLQENLHVTRKDKTSPQSLASRATLVLSTAMHAGVGCWWRLQRGERPTLGAMPGLAGGLRDRG
jgi:hypothetical protein